MKIIKDYPLLAYPHHWIRNSDLTTLLHIQPLETFIAAKNEQGNIIALSLNIGTQNIGRLFKHEPPTPEEIEAAINIIEDELMLAIPALPKCNQLITNDSFVQTILNVAENTATNDSLNRDELERTFTRFAVISMGRSPQSDVIPVDAEFAAYFLILREIMHHLKFETVTYLDSSQK